MQLQHFPLNLQQLIKLREHNHWKNQPHYRESEQPEADEPPKNSETVIHRGSLEAAKYRESKPFLKVVVPGSY